jgi:short-subunit dehydrogenase
MVSGLTELGLRRVVQLSGPNSRVPLVADLRQLGGALRTGGGAVPYREAAYVLRMIAAGEGELPLDEIRPALAEIFDVVADETLGRSLGFLYGISTPTEHVDEVWPAGHQAAAGRDQGRVGPGEPVPGRAGGGGVTALVTGASSGIGAAFARQLAAEGQDLVVVARDADRLEGTAASLRSGLRGRRRGAAGDLAVEADTSTVRTRLSDVDRPVDLLVNSAGIGLPESSGRRRWPTRSGCSTSTARPCCGSRTRRSGAMVPRGRGDIVVVSSVSGFAPTVRGSYGASKAWATAFAESLSGQLAGTGVHVSAVAPGFVRTEFHGRAGLDMAKVPGFMWLDAGQRGGDRAARPPGRQGAQRAGRQYKVIVAASRLVPPSVNRLVTERFRRRAL